MVAEGTTTGRAEPRIRLLKQFFIEYLQPLYWRLMAIFFAMIDTILLDLLDLLDSVSWLYKLKTEDEFLA